jgi:hypothetical protein
MMCFLLQLETINYLIKIKNMTLNLDTRKYRLIKTTMDLNDEMSIGFLENQVEELEQKAKFWGSNPTD